MGKSMAMRKKARAMRQGGGRQVGIGEGENGMLGDLDRARKREKRRNEPRRNERPSHGYGAGVAWNSD